ncbi:RNA polymerase sigma factor [Brenneria tiliae]|uniref:RNA polymerase sigma factor n=1 Tax=Brenneria tiliae TaxID=2914984 RepID=UPI002014AEB7|nr:sigma-70 family RNA polymerase sigma factor [Brenneria tiliae]MCL2898741.1 sigma-70 family RNA polymerase sigma factor [Brenneria tiliae]MCL2903322.1 sigma-70 family RNA polymerase sigma factor [Brenneria tiliae]
MWDLKRLFQKHSRDINRFLRKRGHRPDVAADLTQDVFLRILSAAPPERDDNPLAYLRRVARNLSIDLYRREQLVEKGELPDEEYGGVADPAPNPETINHDRQRLAMAHRALMELPERTRRAFELYRLGDMTIAEVAAELDLSVSRTWSLIQHAYLHLRSRLKEGGD